MNIDELLQRLESGMPLSPEEIALVQGAINDGTISGVEALRVQDLLVATTGQSSGALPEEMMASTPPDPEEQAEFEAATRERTDDELIGAALSGEELSEEERDRIEQDQDIQRVIAEYGGQIQVPPWVYAPDGGRIYRTLTNDDLDGMVDSLLELEPSLEAMLVSGGYAGEDQANVERRNFVSFVLASGSELAQLVVNEWGIENDARVEDRIIDGQSASTVFQLSSQMGIRSSEAAHLLNTADRFGIPRELMAVAYQQNRRESGRLSTYAHDRDNWSRPTRGSRRTNRVDQQEEGPIPEGSSGARLDPQKISAHRIGVRLNEGMEMYGDRVTAAVYVQNPELAHKMFTDPWSMNREELQEAIDALGDQDVPGGKEQMDWLRARRDGQLDMSAGQGESRDTDAAREAARTLAAEWNMTSLPNSVLDAIAGGWLGNARGAVQASLPNPFNPDLSIPQGGGVEDRALDLETFVRNHLRSLPEYQELFGNMTEGEDEDDYAGRFQSQASGLLGNVATGEAARAGMRTGDIDTVGQQAISSGSALKSSTFQERLAVLADAFRSGT